jgi:hypothetical protein
MQEPAGKQNSELRLPRAKAQVAKELVAWPQSLDSRLLNLGLTTKDPSSDRRNVRLEGYSLHANVAIHANDRDAMESLASTLARGPMATKRLSQLADGRLAYTLKRRWRDGTVAIALTKRELIERLAAQVRRPREHLNRYARMPAPNHTMCRRLCRDRESVREEGYLQTKRHLVQRLQEALHAQPTQAARSCQTLPSGTWKCAFLFQ